MDEKLNSSEVPIEEVNDVPLDQVDSEPLMHPLPIGESLTALDTYPITASEQSKFVVIMGATGSGKTTLITSIYQQFLKEELPKHFYFAGSKTLMAFEERAYYTRVACEGTEPETARTPRGSLDNILHIRVQDCQSESFSNLLFADFSGEDYENASANPLEAKEKFSLVKAATSLIVLIDGSKIANFRSQHSEVQQAIHMLRTFCDSGLVRTDAFILLVVSKYDLVEDISDSALRQFVDSIINEFIEQLPSCKNRCRLLKVAAMPKNSEMVPIGYGLMELFEMMMATSSTLNNNNEPVEMKSQFNLWKERNMK